ncbi:MAG: GNAT family N-acetyltransferase [Thermoplasmatales archaeon]
MFVQFHPFKTAQLDEVVELSRKNLTERYSDFVFLDIQRAWPSGFIVAMADNTIAGFICGGLSGDREARILMLAVDLPYRRKGIGSALISLFEQEAIKVRVRKIRLEVRTDNNEAIAFYRMHGYSISGLLPSYYNDGTDAFTMEKTIAKD